MEYFVIKEKLKIDKLEIDLVLKNKILVELKKEILLFKNVDKCKSILHEFNSSKLEISCLKSEKYNNNLRIKELNIKVDRLKNIAEKSKSILPDLLRKKKNIENERINFSIYRHNQKILFELVEENKKIENRLVEDDKTFNKLKLFVEKYESFNINNNESKIIELSEDINNIKSEIEQNELVLNKLYEILATDINKLNDNIEKYFELKSYQTKLNNSRNSYDKKLIHDEIRIKFGNGNVNKLLNEIRIDIDKSKKHIERSANKIRDKYTRERNKIVIQESCKNLLLDGNNLLYSKTNEKLGLERVLFLIHHLYKKYNVTIIFDNNYTQKDINQLTEAIPKEVKITSVRYGEKADDLLVSLGDYKKDTYIISNDNFIEYSTNEIIKSKRIIKHDISRDFIRIPNLEINLEY